MTYSDLVFCENILYYRKENQGKFQGFMVFSSLLKNKPSEKIYQLEMQ